MTAPPLRAGIIGTGAIAHAHAAALAENPDRVALVAVADVDASRAEAFAAQYAGASSAGAPASYTDAEQMLAAQQLDLVHICTPPLTHAPLAIAAMRAGAVALVEKPTVLSLREMDELAAVSDQTGVPVLTVFQHRFGSAAVRLRRLVAEGALGRPLVATCETQWYRDADYFAVPWRGRWETEGGGPTMGHGIHQFDLLLSILGPWARVSAFASRTSRPTDTEDVSVALVEFDSGALATIVNSVVSARETSRLRFDFEFATIELEHLYGYRDHDWTFTPAPGHEHLAERWKNENDTMSSHSLQLTQILDALAEGREPEVGVAEARRTLELAAGIFASAFGQQPVRAGDIDADHPFAQRMVGTGAPWPAVKGAWA